MIKHFYLFRHGQTDLNAAGRFQGQSCNLSLNQQGRLQAEKMADILQDKNIEAILSSPLKRSLETAEIIGEKMGLPVSVDSHFIEGNFGEIEGKTREELTTEEAVIFNQWVKLDPLHLDIRFNGGESKRQIQNRVFSGLKKLALKPYQSMAVVTHSSVLRMLLLAMGRVEHKIGHGYPFHLVYKDGIFSFANEEKILLLSCCAPCSCAVIEKMAEEKRNFEVVFYNPNIVPKEEYKKRCEENKRVCDLYHVNFIELEYDPRRWQSMTKGLEDEPERGKRCSICFYMRLKRVMEFAKANGFTSVASVLGVSRWKDLDQVNLMADLAAQSTGCPYTYIEGRKQGMQQRRSELIKSLELYNQEYCGCKPVC